MSSIQNTPWKDLSKIKNLFKLDFPKATFELFPMKYGDSYYIVVTSCSYVELTKESRLHKHDWIGHYWQPTNQYNQNMGLEL